MENNLKQVVTRFAPSPTGFMHVGGVRTALFAYLFARKHNGKFILRIEDTDKEREVEGSIEHIIKSLNWLGIDYDEGPDKPGENGPYIQSKRLEIYRKYADKLIEKGLAYPDPYSQEELTAFREKAEAEKRPFLYREHRPEKFEDWDGTKPLRLKITDIKRYEWHDLVYGDLSAGVEALDDFILIKSDGYPTYNFAHIVDDLEMGVTHVIRAQEFISSTPKFLALYEALGIKPPFFATLPHIMAESGNKKLSKRDGAKDLLIYKEEGFLKEALVNFLAFLGWNPGDEREVMSITELIKDFNIEKVQKGGAKWNEEKLKWLNKEYIKKLSYEEQEEFVLCFLSEEIKSHKLFSNELVHNITPVVIDRVSTGLEIKEMCDSGELNFFLEQPKIEKENLFFKSSKIPEENKYNILIEYLTKTISLLDSVENWTKENIKETVWAYAEEVGRGDLLWPLRFSLTGLPKSPEPFLVAEILGKEETMNRINNAIKVLS